MIIQFENFQIKLDEILNDRFSLSEFIGIEFNVLKLISDWFSDQDTFVFKTSGSTGKSKEISIHRKLIEYSVKATFDHIDPENKIESAILCLDPNFIGGAMVVFRAAIMHHDLFVIKPSNNPLENLKPNDHYGLISMVPLQYQNSDVNKINQVSHILIGGGQINTINNADVNAKVYATFGMTETISHIALRKIEQSIFTTTGDARVSVDADSALIIKGSITDNQILKTNDIVELISETEFKWIGRKDFIINSGGIKLNPESIEGKLSNQLSFPYLISSLPDDYLGQKLVLVIEASNQISVDFSVLSKYEIPKEVIYIQEIPKTKTGKVDRNSTQRLIIKKD